MLAISLATKMQYVDQVLVHYRDTSDASLSKTRSQSSDTIFYVLRDLKENLENLGLYQKLKKDYKGLTVHLLVADYYRLNSSTLPIYLRDLDKTWLGILELHGLDRSDFRFDDDYHRYQIIMEKLRTRVCQELCVSRDYSITLISR
jgi:hypothetical protein